MSKFKIGDRVIYDDRHKGTIAQCRKDLMVGNTCLIEFDDCDLIPPQLVVPEYTLKLITPKYHPKNYCPICNTKWTITKFNMKEWKDCGKCKKTKEQIEKERGGKKNEPK